MCLLIHFGIKNVYVPFGYCKYYVSVFIRFELLSFEHGSPISHKNVKYNCLALLLGYNQVFFHPEVLDFLHIYFPHNLSISEKPHLF